MSDALAHAPLPIAVFRGPHQECVIASESWQRLFHPHPPAPLLERLADAQRSQHDVETHLRFKERAYRVMIKPLPGDELLATCIDETLAIQAHAEVTRVRRFKEQLLTAISHDLRAPMSTILLWERVLRDRIDEVDIRQRALDAIRESATVQTRVISELGDVSSVASGAVALARARVPLESLLSAAIELHHAAARSKQIQITRDYHLPLGDVHADGARLRNAFEKVIESALRITPTGATIKIAARRRRGTIMIEIGAGESTPRSRHAESVDDLELGLVVAAELLAMHAGTLEAHRPERDCAPTYTISLPSVSRRQTRP